MPEHGGDLMLVILALQFGMTVISAVALTISILAWREARRASAGRDGKENEAKIITPSYLNTPAYERREPIKSWRGDTSDGTEPSRRYVEYYREPEYPTVDAASTLPVPSDPAVSPPSAELDLMTDFSRLVETRASDAESFSRDYQPVPVAPTEVEGRFHVVNHEEQAFIWAITQDNGVCVLIPSKEAIKKWRFLAAAKGGGALERFNGAFELLPGPALRMTRPATADRVGSELVLRQRGSLTGIE